MIQNMMHELEIVNMYNLSVLKLNGSDKWKLKKIHK